MYVCPKCGREYKKDVLRRCAYCKKVIGCEYCLTPGTLEYRYCDEHNPKPKKNKDEEILKFIKIFNNTNIDEPLYKHAVFQLTKIANEEEGLNKIIDIFKNGIKKDVSYTLIKGLIDVFKNVRSDKVIEPIVEYIDNLYINDEDMYLNECIELLFEIKTDKAIEKIRELSRYPSVEIKWQILDMLSEISKKGEINPESEILKIYNEILAGREKDVVEKIYNLIDDFSDVDYRVRDNAVRELAEMDCKKELIDFLNSSEPGLLGYTIRTLALKNELKNNDEKNNNTDVKEGEDDSNIDKKIYECIKNEYVFVKENAILYLKSKGMYDKIFEAISDDSTNVKISALDALIEGGEHAKEYIDKIMESDNEYAKIYITNEEMRYAENVKREIELHKGYAQDFLTYDKFEEAIEEYKEILNIDKNNAEAYLNLGEIYFTTYRYKEAEEYAKKHLEIVQDSEGWKLLGKIYNNKGMEREAIDAFKKSIAIKDNFVSHLFLGEIYQRNKNFDEAIKEYRDVLKIDDNPNVRLRIVDILKEQVKKEDTINELKKGIEAFPDEIEFYKTLSMMLVEEGKPNEAEKFLREAYKRFPYDLDIQGMFASVLFHLHRYKESEQMIKKIFAENPDIVNSEKHAILHEILGASLGEQGKITEARRELKIAHRLDPSFGME